MELEPEEGVSGLHTSLNQLLAGVGSPPSRYYTSGFPIMPPQRRRAHQQPQPSTIASTSGVQAEETESSAAASISPRRSRRVAAARNRHEDTIDSPITVSSTSPAVSKPAPRATRKRSVAAAAAAASSEKKPATARAKRARKGTRKPPPNAKDDSQYATEGKAKKDSTSDKDNNNNDDESSHSCCICMSEPEREQLSTINGCGHHFCFDCIAKWSERENKCPLCKVRFTKIVRVHKAKSKRGEKRTANTKSVRDRDQRSDLVSGAALEAMLNSIAASSRTNEAPGSSFRSLFGASGPGRNFRSSGPGSFRLGDWLADGSGDSDEEDSMQDMPGFPSDFNAMMRRSLELGRENRRSRQAAAVAAAAHASVPLPPSPPNLGATWGPFASFPSAMPLGNTLFHHHTFQMAPPLAPMPPSPLPASQRTYAVNGQDNSAGATATNPLVIDISSDDDDDEVEFVGTSATMSNR